MNLDQLLSTRAKMLWGSLGKQTSVAVDGLINLGSGTPDFAPPSFVFEAMQQALNAKHVRYTPWAGIPELRAAIAQKLRRENAIDVDPETEVVVTCGAQEALMVTLMTILDPGDHALIPSPHYDEYSRDALILGGALIPVPTTSESGFQITAAALEQAITPQTKAIVLVTPNNPTGTVLGEWTLRDIGLLAQERDLLIVADEIYEHYLFDGAQHISMASLPGLRERTITINSFSKSFGMTGLRLGYIAAPEPIMDAMLPFHHGLMVCAPSIVQYGGVAALAEPRDWFAPILADYGQRRERWMTLLDSIGLRYVRPHGSYYVFIDIRPTGLSSAEFVRKAHDEARLVFQAGTSDGGAGEGFIRSSLTTPPPKLDEGLERFKSFVQNLVVST